jgi:AICAR transformylase/IMP cyclohydrolase PurH
MNIRNTLIAAGTALAISALGASAQSATVQATANATVTVVSPTTITKDQDMVFGTVVRPTTGTNTITLGTNDAVTLSGAGNGSVVASTTSAARFTIASQAAITYTLAPTLTFVQTGLNNIAVSAPAVLTGTLGSVSANGTQDIKYGAAFDIGVATTPQNYTGTLTVVVTYN